MQNMVPLLEDMEKVTMNQNTNVTRATKPNATPLLVRFHLIIVRIEKVTMNQNTNVTRATKP